jgi:hypothetical protein
VNRGFYGLIVSYWQIADVAIQSCIHLTIRAISNRLWDGACFGMKIDPIKLQATSHLISYKILTLIMHDKKGLFRLLYGK